jgi:hypothetical protein
MTQDEIIEMAKEARIHRDDSWRFEMLQEKNALEAFAKLVAEAEREACKQIIQQTPLSNWFQADVIEAIDKRGQA